MGFLDKFKKGNGKNKAPKKASQKEEKILDVDIKDKEIVKKKESAKKSVKQSKKSKKGLDKKTERLSSKDTGNAYKVLVRPMVTEKSTELANQGKYVFEVSLDANKIEIAKAIRVLYEVEPESINVINVRGKVVNFGRIAGKRKNFKKAIVTLKKGEKIEVFEGV